MRLREFHERQRLDENPAVILLPLLGLLSGGAMLSQPKIEKWIKNNPVEADKFSKEVKKVLPNPANPQSITNPIGNAIEQSWNWLTGGSTKKDNVQQKTKPPQPGDYKQDKNGLLIRKDAEKQIAPKVQYDQYISQYNTNQDGKFRGKIPPQTLGNIRSQGDAGKGWVNQYNDLYKKRSQINKQIAADIKNGMTKQQLDQKYGDNLKNLNRNLNDHLGKVDDFSKGLKPLQQRNIKTYKTVPLQQPKAGDIIKDKFGTNKVVTQKELDDMKRKQQGQLSSVGTVGGVSGQKDKGSAGATIGGGGMDIGIKGSGAVSGDKGKTKPGDITGPEIGIKGTTTGTGAGTITGPEVDIKGQSIGTTGTQSQTIGRDVATTNQKVISRTAPPQFMAPPIAQAPQGPKYRKYDPKRDTDIIYKGQTPPKRILDLKPGKQDSKYFANLRKSLGMKKI